MAESNSLPSRSMGLDSSQFEGATRGLSLNSIDTTPRADRSGARRGNVLTRCTTLLMQFVWWCIVRLIFFVANLSLPLVYLVQMLSLDMVLLEHYGWVAMEWLWIFGLTEVLLFVHLVWHVLYTTMAARSGNLQWIAYSWIISAKTGLIFFGVLPQLPTEDTGQIWSARSIMTVMVLTPVFYTVLTFRTLRQLGLFQTAVGLTRTQQSGGRRKYVTLDAALLQDMVWHVVIDMVDIMNMMFVASVEDSGGLATQFLAVMHREEVSTIQTLTGLCIVLALFFHQQSFPSIGYMGTSSSTGVSPDTPPDVVKARKRSAIVSILLVDMPFFAIRTYLYVTSMSAPSLQVGEGSRSDTSESALVQNRPQLDKLWVKNVLCMLLQAMQLRFVQQAEQERSQSLGWWDVRRQVDVANTRIPPKKRSQERDESLQRAWQEMDQAEALSPGDLLETVFADLGVGDESETSSPVASRVGSSSAGMGSKVEEESQDGESTKDDNLAAEQADGAKSAAAGRRRRIRGFCRCCCCCCCCYSCCRSFFRSLLSKSGTSLALLCHAVMGLVLGWIIAKVDFAQLVNDMVLGHGLAAP